MTNAWPQQQHQQQHIIIYFILYTMSQSKALKLNFFNRCSMKRAIAAAITVRMKFADSFETTRADAAAAVSSSKRNLQAQSSRYLYIKKRVLCVPTWYDCVHKYRRFAPIGYKFWSRPCPPTTNDRVKTTPSRFFLFWNRATHTQKMYRPDLIK